MYQKLDLMLLDNVKSTQGASLNVAVRGDAQVEAERISKATGRELFRILDGRLQALRKKGLIKHIGGAWHWFVEPVLHAD